MTFYIPAPSEFLVNTEASDDQNIPTITGLDTGGFVISWRTDDITQDGSSSAIKARVFSVLPNAQPELGASAPDASVTEDILSPIDLSAYTVVDPDLDDVTLTLAVDRGAVSAVQGNGTVNGVTIAGSGTSAMTLMGSAADLNAYLDSFTVQYQSDLNDTATATLTVTPNDGTVDGTADTIAVNVTPVNDAPTSTGAPASLTIVEDTETGFDLSGLTITDIDSAQITVELPISAGSFAAPADGSGVGSGVTATLVNANLVRLVGSPADISTYLDIPANIKYTPPANAFGNGTAFFSIMVDDGDGSGLFALAANIPVNVTAVNDKPAASGPPSVTATEDTMSDLDLSGVTFADIDTTVIEARFIAANGTFAPPAPAPGSGVSVPVASSTDITLRGTPADITAFLDTVGALRFQPAANLAGPNAASIEVRADDGSGEIILGTLGVNVTAVNDAPVLTGSGNTPVLAIGQPVTLDANATLSDVDLDALNGGAGDYAGARISLSRQGGANTDDVFGPPSTGNLVVDTATGAISDLAGNRFATLTLPGDGTMAVEFTSAATPATRALAIEVLQAIVYTNTGGGVETVTLAVEFSDGMASAVQTVSVSMDLQAPAAPDTPDLTNAADTGASNSDNVTNQANATVTVAAEDGSTVVLSSDTGGPVGTAVATGGVATITTSTLADGVHQLTATARDGVGNLSPVSAPLTVTVDTATPTLSAPDLVATSDTGTSDSDDKTADATPTIAFTVEAGATLEVDFGDGNGFAAAGTGTGASQDLTLATPYGADGDKVVQLRATDTAGNQTTRSLTVTYNQPPSGITLSQARIAENSAAGTVVGIFATVDPSIGDSHMLSLINDAGGRFQIQGNALVATGTGLDFETLSTHMVELRATDAIGSSITQSFQIAVDDVPEGPVGNTPASSAPEVMTASGEGTVFYGSPSNFNGDTIEQFSGVDTIQFANTQLSRNQVQVSGNQPAILTIDPDGAGPQPPVARITLNGDYSGGTFMVVEVDGDTLVTYETFLPNLVDQFEVAPAQINGINNQPFLQGDGIKTYSVTFSGNADAAFDNGLGVYEITPSGQIVDVRILANNVKTAATAGTPVAITGVEDGNNLSFFLVQDGADFLNGLTSADTFSFVDSAGAAANANAGTEVFLAVNGAAAVDVTAFHTFASHLNPGGVTQVLSGVTPDGAAITLGFEDLVGIDNDYQDVLLTVALG